MNFVLFAVVVIVLILNIVIIINIHKKNSTNDNLKVDDKIEAIKSQITISLIKEIKNGQIETNSAISDGLKTSSDDLTKKLDYNINKIENTLKSELDNIRNTTDKKLSDIQGNVNEKLDNSLNKRLDDSFGKIGERLEKLYNSLGKLQSLEGGVENLNKTLSNIKKRGIYGETQLRNILEDILVSSQYDENVEIRKNSGERVEFAIKIPSKEDNKDFIYLPIDAKFPLDLYNSIIDGSKSGDKELVDKAVKELENKVKKDAKDIRDKYISPPVSTDFAIMFIPTESMYAEILRIDNLSYFCQNKYKVIICGPQNLTAVLNSLSIGFKYLTVNKNTKEVLKVLDDFRAQYSKYSEIIEKIERNINSALKTTDELKDRNKKVGDKLKKLDNINIEFDNSNSMLSDFSS